VESKRDTSDLSWVRDTLYVAVICDVLDQLGYRQQAMHQRLRPLDPDNCVILGRARTWQWMEVAYIGNDPYRIEIAAVDALRPGDVVVHSTDAGASNAPWGELMTTAAAIRGCVGCICDSQIRDCTRIRAMRFPVFHAGVRPVDSQGRGRVVEFDVPINCGGVVVHPGDLIFADFDGVVVIPRDVEASALEAARAKTDKESVTRRELARGRLLADVYAEYGVL
jgi:4-hydroxy-4-methyl-2-oxoglutarate aldolase